MDPDCTERFERIEKNTESMQRALRDLIDGMQNFQKSLVGLKDTLEQYSVVSNARMTRVEENLELLIQAITTEHKNGRNPS